MQVVLGSSTYDVSYRALVIGCLDPVADDHVGRADLCRQAELLVAMGADALAIDAMQGGDATGPAVVACQVEALRACAGVPVVVASARIEVVLAAARAGASVLMPADAVALAVAGGVPAGAVLIDGGEPIDTPAAPPPAYPVVVSTSDAAGHAVAIVSGHRLLHTRDVRGARRVADVLAAIFDAAATPPGSAPTVPGSPADTRPVGR